MRWKLTADVPDEDVRLLLSVARRRRFDRNEVVFRRDDPADSLHLIAKGRFAVRIMTPVGETVTVAVRGRESFGEMALVGEGRKRAATVGALEEAETFAVYQTDFQRLRKQHPAVNEVLIAFLAEEQVVVRLTAEGERRLAGAVAELALHRRRLVSILSRL